MYIYIYELCVFFNIYLNINSLLREGLNMDNN